MSSLLAVLLLLMSSLRTGVLGGVTCPYTTAYFVGISLTPPFSITGSTLCTLLSTVYDGQTFALFNPYNQVPIPVDGGFTISNLLNACGYSNDLFFLWVYDPPDSCSVYAILNVDSIMSVPCDFATNVPLVCIIPSLSPTLQTSTDFLITPSTFTVSQLVTATTTNATLTSTVTTTVDTTTSLLTLTTTVPSTTQTVSTQSSTSTRTATSTVTLLRTSTFSITETVIIGTTTQLQPTVLTTVLTLLTTTVTQLTTSLRTVCTNERTSLL
jgi:hypothetical protein